jgi:hypothetical protein
LGNDTILSIFRDGAELLGIDADTFNPHSLRAFFVTNLVNDDRVSLCESMAEARHTSVSAHLMLARSKETEGNRIEALLDSRRDQDADPSTQEMIETLNKKRMKLRRTQYKDDSSLTANLDELDVAEKE